MQRLIYALTIGAIIVVIMREYGKLIDRLSLSAERTTAATREHAMTVVGTGPPDIEQPEPPRHPMMPKEGEGGINDGPMPWEDDPFDDRFLMDEDTAFRPFGDERA